jgi:MoaD family protein
MRVRLFASLRELAGSSQMELDAPDVGDLLDQLSRKFGPEFDRIMAAGSVVVDGERAGRDHRLEPQADVALLPPVSGGSAPPDRRVGE